MRGGIALARALPPAWSQAVRDGGAPDFGLGGAGHPACLYLVRNEAGREACPTDLQLVFRPDDVVFGRVLE